MAGLNQRGYGKNRKNTVADESGRDPSLRQICSIVKHGKHRWRGSDLALSFFGAIDREVPLGLLTQLFSYDIISFAF